MRENNIRGRLLESIRKRLKKISNNEDELFYNRRWIFARLQLDERKEKNAIKKLLLSGKNILCWKCKRKIRQRKGIVLHRKNGKGYSKRNSVIMHSVCHQKLHYGGTDNRSLTVE